MVTPHIAFRLITATVLLGAVALAGNAMAKPGPAAETAIASTATTTAAAEIAPTPETSEPAACLRKVKVVYSGYGEADRAGCAVSAKSTN